MRNPAIKLFAKTFLIGSMNRARRHVPIQKPSQNTYRQPIQEPIFSVPNTEF
jgi:hypothetical protein